MRHIKQTHPKKQFPPPFYSCGRFKTGYQEELNHFQTSFGRRFTVISIICLFGLIPFINNEYFLHLLNIICIYAIVAMGLNILTGYTGQLSLGHGAFFGIGAYTGALLSAKAGLPFFIVIPIAGIAASMIGSIFALPAVRLKPIYLPMTTLAGQFIVEYILLHWDSLTGGSKGLAIPAPALAGLNLGGNLSLFYIITICLLLLTWLTNNLLRSKIGRAFLAIRQNERAASAMGITVFQHKLLAFAVSSFFAGVAGALFAYSTTTITPTFFNLTLSIEFLAVIIIGGIGSISGSMVGALVIVSLNEILTFFAGYFMDADMTRMPLHEFILGLTIVMFMVLEPEGLARIWRDIKWGLKRWPFF
jgi:branched-chain amino acid transport system permease protein